MLDKATLTLGDNRRVDLSQTVIFPDVNLGGGEITELMEGAWDLFNRRTNLPLDSTKRSNARPWKQPPQVSPEFMNRLDKIVVFHPLRREQLERGWKSSWARCSSAFWKPPRSILVPRDRCRRDFLLQEGTDQRYGARHLNALSNAMSYIHWRTCWHQQVHLGDLVCIDWNKEQDCLTLIQGYLHRGGERKSRRSRRGRSIYRRKQRRDARAKVMAALHRFALLRNGARGRDSSPCALDRQVFFTLADEGQSSPASLFQRCKRGRQGELARLPTSSPVDIRHGVR